MGLHERMHEHEREQRLREQITQAETVRQEQRRLQGGPSGPVIPQDPYGPEDYGEAHEAWLACWAPERLEVGGWRLVRNQRHAQQDRARSVLQAQTARKGPEPATQGPEAVSEVTHWRPATDAGWLRELNRDEANTLHLHVKVGPFVLATLATLAQQWDALLPDVLEEVLVRGCEMLREAAES